jgi:hypothetical protein
MNRWASGQRLASGTGGCTTALLVTDKAAAEVRPTYDVDAIAEITSYVEYAEFSERLKALGFCWRVLQPAGFPYSRFFIPILFCALTSSIRGKSRMRRRVTGVPILTATHS